MPTSTLQGTHIYVDLNFRCLEAPNLLCCRRFLSSTLAPAAQRENQNSETPPLFRVSTLSSQRRNSR